MKTRRYSVLPLLALLLAFVLLSSLYNRLVPLGEGPDEPGHFRYVLFLAHEGRLPLQHADPSRSDVPGEGHQPPLTYLLAVPAVGWLPADALLIEQSANPQFLWRDGQEAAAFVRASREYWPWHSTILGWHLARSVSTLLGAVTLVCIWGAAHTFFAHRFSARWAVRGALLAAALVAFNPQFLFTSALVTNDMLLAALSAALFWLCLAATGSTDGRPRAPLRFALLAGALVGLALLTKQSALLLFPLLAWFLWRAADGSTRRAVLLFGVSGGTVALVAGWWFGRNWLLYGDPLGLAAFQATYATQPFEWRSFAAWGSALTQLFASFWARFGWLSLRPPEPIIWLYAALTLMALAGLLRAGMVNGWRWELRRWLPVVLLIGLALAWTVTFALLAGLVGWQGRMLFPALPAIALVLARGLLHWLGVDGTSPVHSGVAVRSTAMGILLVCLISLACLLPITVIRPAYEWQTLAPAAAESRLASSHERQVYARYARPWEQGVELRGWHATRRHQNQRSFSAPEAGQEVSIDLLWHALERREQDWTVFVHLVNAEGEIVAEHNSTPVHGELPFPQWTPGDWVSDPHPLHLPADLPPGEYTLRVGLYLPWQRDPQKGRREQVWNAEGEKIGDMAEIGTLTVRKPEFHNSSGDQ